MVTVAGLQKLTLLDYPAHTACTVFLAGCNFRCPFCHNAPLVTDPSGVPTIEEDAFFSFLEKRRGLLDGVCITGGEPTLYPDLPDFIRRIREKGFAVKLDTNGSNPSLLSSLLSQGLLDYVAMDIKASPEKYPLAIGLSSFDFSLIQKSASVLMNGTTEYEFRTTVVQELHEPDDFHAIGQWLLGASRYFLQGFIDSGHIIKDGLHACDRSKMLAMRSVLQSYIPHTELRGVD